MAKTKPKSCGQLSKALDVLMSDKDGKVTEPKVQSPYNWDKCMLEVAHTIAKMSKHPTRQVGAVIVSPNRKQVAFGYNGFPSDIPDLQRWWDQKDDAGDDFGRHELCNHAEENAISQARMNVAGWTLYCTLQPCLDCSRRIVTERIARVVYATAIPNHSVEEHSADKAMRLLSLGGVDVELIEL